MSVNIKPTQTETNIHNRIDFAIALFSQEIWCWGQDILRPEGNWLIEQGFELIRPPVEDKKLKNIYIIEPAEGRQIMLRGFGVIYTDTRFGSIYLPRYEFIPYYSASHELEILPWNVDCIPGFAPPFGVQRRYSALMLRELIQWIANYESNILQTLGYDYRLSTLEEWDDGKRVIIPPDDISLQWEKLVDDVDELMHFAVYQT